MGILLSFFVAAFLALLSLPAAAQEVPTGNEVSRAEGMPAVIPHRVADTDTFRECLKCHETGRQGAPVTPHPERLACTQCHVPGEAKAARPARKKR